MSDRDVLESIAQMNARKPSEAQGVAWGFLTLVASAVISRSVRPYAELTDLIMIYLLGVVLIATRFSTAVSVGTAVLSILSFDFLFIPPPLVFAFPDLKSIVTFSVMIVVAGVISKLNARLRAEQAASRRSEEGVQRAQVQIETERMRNALLSTVSHDLKAPLSAIIAAGTTLSNEQSNLDWATRAELSATIVEAAERLEGLVTNLLSATRLEAGTIALNRSVEAIDELVGAVLSRFAARLGARVVHLDIPPDLPLLSVDPKLIELVLVNLVENALRYTPEQTPLHISARSTDDEVVVSVADEGAGISELERENVFEKFFRGSQARSNDGGAGLGLMICRAAVGAHGGRISALSRPGGGARIEFTLPKAQLSVGRLTE